MSTTHFSRRQFLRIVAIAGTAAGAGVMFNHRLNQPATVSASRLLMGTVVNLTVIGEDRAAAQTAIDDTLQHMADLETVLSRHQPTSELSRLNQVGYLNHPSPYLVEVLQQAADVSERTSGAFDVTVKPLLDLYTTRQQTGKFQLTQMCKPYCHWLAIAICTLRLNASHWPNPIWVSPWMVLAKAILSMRV